MRDQARYFATSLGIHLSVLMLLLGLTAQAVKHAPPITLDFTLTNCQIPEPPREKPKQPPSAPKEAPPPQPTPVKQEAVHQPPQPAPPAPLYAAPTPDAPPPARAVQESVPRPVATAPPPIAAPRAAPPGDDRGSAEKAQQRYLKEHFTYIRELIMKRLTYPPVARRMGWTGRVVLVFVVTEDGTVRSLRVKESSGYPALDNSAMETVKNAAPFPRPPVAAELVMPVQFNLQ